MSIVFDPLKDQLNQTNHGCSLALAASFEWDTGLEKVDNRKNYGEVRLSSIGFIGDRLYVVVFTIRDETKRIISLRKANKREVNKYAKT